MSNSKKPNKLWKVINLSLLALLLALVIIWKQWPDEYLHLIACDVGQGDGLLIVYGDYQVVVDGGPNDNILACLSENMPFWDKNIEALVMTHPQADHMSGFVEIVRRYQVGQLLAPSIANDIDQFWALKEVILEKGVPVREVTRGDRLKLGPLELTTLWPEESGGNQLAWAAGELNAKILGAQTVADPNLFSIVLLGRFGKNSFLLTGDIDQKIEKELVASGLSGVEVLKVAHHGSKYSSAESFLEAVRPKVALISVGKNRFGHPTPEVLERLKNVKAQVFRTDELGSIELISNGTNWWQN